MSATPWSHERFADLQRFVALGLSFGQIAKEMSKQKPTSRSAVAGKLRRHAIKASPERQQMRNQARQARYRAKRAAEGKLVASRPPMVRIGPNLQARALPVASSPVRFIDLGAQMCRYPLGAPYDAPEWFCGAVCEPDRPYCSPHCGLCYRPRS